MNVYIVFYYTNTNEIPGELSHAIFTSEKITVAIGDIVNRALRIEKYLSEMFWYFIGVLYIRTLLGSLEIRNFFKNEKRSFAFPRGLCYVPRLKRVLLCKKVTTHSAPPLRHKREKVVENNQPVNSPACLSLPNTYHASYKITYCILYIITQTKKIELRARYGTWTHDPQIKSLMLYRLS